MPMHASFADWYRSAAVSPPEGLLQKRWAGVEDLAKRPEADLIIGLARLFVLNKTDEAIVPIGMRDAFRAHDETFQSKGNLQELRVLAGAVLRQVIEEKQEEAATTAALALCCGCFATRVSAVPEREHIDAAERFLVSRGRELRARGDTPKIQSPSFTKEQYTKLVPVASFQPQQIVNAHEQLFTVFDEVMKKLSKGLAQARDAIELLERTVDAQDEEINLLWWLQSATSRDLKGSFREVGPVVGTLLFPKELSDLTVFIPGPDAVFGLLLRALDIAGASADFSVSISEAVNAAPRSWRQEVAQQKLESAEALCPVSLALAKSMETDGSDDWLPIYRKACDIPSDAKIGGVQFSLQVYRERMLLRLMEAG
jgi:hypothetical protein